jgi:predicted secreted protein
VFGLAIFAGRVERELKEVYRDRELPSSRRCPIAYQLADVIVPNNRKSSVAVVFLHTLNVGFEGKDARFIAVPVKLSG